MPIFIEKSKSKLHNKKVHTEEGVFDSIKEYRRWQQLKILQRAGVIKDLKKQVPFELIPSQKGEDGKVIERVCKYVADFTYTETDTGKEVVEDAKGFRAEEYKIKRKLMLYKYGIKILET